MIQITAPQSPADFDAVRDLCWEYRALLLALGPPYTQIVETFYPEAKYAALTASLETEHAPPGGAIRIARAESGVVGCGMSHTLMPGTAEIKRVYLQDRTRGLGAGRALMQALVDQCRADGFSRIVMDTGKALAAARALYLSMGFRERGPYQDIPALARDHMIYFEMAL